MKIAKKIIITAGIILFTLNVPQKVFAAVNTLRISGNDRYETAIKISQNSWQTSEYVVLASGEDFPDALCAAPLAKRYNAPILLSPKYNMDSGTLEEIKRLNTKNIYIIGGTGAIPKSTEDMLVSMGIKCTRLGGKDRYDTSLIIAEKLGDINTVFIASGDDFPDAISVAAISSIKNVPIILSSKSTITPECEKFINSYKIQKKYIIGGTGAIDDSVFNKVSNAERVYGDDRYETNVAVIKRFYNEYNFNNVYTASGGNFPDALSGSAAAAMTNSPLFLVSKDTTPFIREYIRSVKTGIQNVIILGGSQALSINSIKAFLSEDGIKVVIDPGHGGYDPGAKGYSGSLEKDINLAVGLEAGRIIEGAGINVIYTRKDDNVTWESNVMDDLKSRCEIANNTDADYFISIHCDSYPPNSSANGTSVFYYGQSKEAQKFASFMQSEITNSIGSYDRGIKTANFYVIKNTNATSILIELGFLSNPDEEKNLINPEYQKKYGDAIAKAFIKYIEEK